ncbi:hypothetical protein [Breoghania sp. L-A4]|uniref:hypothetical protein n=1 Tax=Breoghania sp. L-A4 TaxID=2304600 RepID=UPI0013C2FF1F|nr:hypothetical protein [Breoghania sp. L-A4]
MSKAISNPDKDAETAKPARTGRSGAPTVVPSLQNAAKPPSKARPKKPAGKPGGGPKDRPRPAAKRNKNRDTGREKAHPPAAIVPRNPSRDGRSPLWWRSWPFSPASPSAP